MRRAARWPRVAEKRPRESTEETVRPAYLVDTQTAGASSSARFPKRAEQQTQRRREQCWKQREVGDEEAGNRDGHPGLQPAILRHDTAGPVDRTGEVDAAGGESKNEGAAGSLDTRGQQRRQQGRGATQAKGGQP